VFLNVNCLRAYGRLVKLKLQEAKITKTTFIVLKEKLRPKMCESRKPKRILVRSRIAEKITYCLTSQFATTIRYCKDHIIGVR
jgi:hypothetical protein